MFIAMIIALSMIISNRGSLHVNYAKLMISREKAKMLAYSGLQIAMSQLAIKEKKEDDAGKSGQTGKGAGAGGEDKTGEAAGSKTSGSSADSKKLWTEKEAKEFITTVWINMYKWQEFKLTEKDYGVDGVIKICIGAEEGKLDINQDFIFDNDPAKRKFVGQKDDQKDAGKGQGGAEQKGGDDQGQKDSGQGGAQQGQEGQKGSDYRQLFENIFKKIDVYIKGANKFQQFESYLKNKQQFEKF
jgi:hypothetical protein